MDGRISEQSSGPVLNTGVSAAREAKLDPPAKIEAICSGVTSKLNRSSLSMTLPDRARTVSSTDSSLPGASHSFDFRFVASDDEVRQLLVAQSGAEHRDITLISHPDDLSQANLVSRLSISEDGSHTLRSGKLFEGSQPLTLVMDIRKLTSEELPKFNDLLDPDNPSLYDKVSQKKRPLGEHVALLVLANPAQLESVGQTDNAPGADFWRRINRPGNTWQTDPQTGNDQAMNISKAPSVLAEFPGAASAMESAMDGDNTVVIDCHLHSNWRQLLLGGPGVDKQGRIQHIPGRLESLRAGQRVILKGANWQDLAFEQAIRQMLAQKSFESNGKLCQLPDDVQFYQMPVRKDELHLLFQTLSHSCEKEGDKEYAPGNPIIINESNISQWLNPIAIAPEGYAVPNINLLEQVRAGGVVTITSPLTEALWFCLLGSLQTIRETTDLKPRLQVAHSKQQPKALGLAENDEHSLRDQPAFKTITYQQQAQASHWINDLESPLVIQVNEQTSLSQLFDNIHVTSEQKAHFGRRQSELQEALASGKPTVLRGLESNPTLQQLLEPLAIGQPLLVNGHLQAYPKAHVTLLWPESAKSPSTVFSSMIATGTPCPEVDIWDINGVRYDIPRAGLPEKALHTLYKAFETVPGDLCNPLPELNEGLLNNLILAARRAQQIDQSPQLLPRHWRKAINSVITHGTRQNPSVRDFMKVACWQLLPDADKKPDEEQTASVDPDRLNDIINSTPQLDRAFVQQNPWPLARAFDPAAFNETQFRVLKLSYEKPFPFLSTEKSLDKLCAAIVAHSPERQRQAIAHQLAVDPAAAEQYQTLAIRPSRQIKRIQDALASGWHLSLSSGQTRSDAIQSLATDCFHMAKTGNSDAECIERIENRLSQSLEWQGSSDKPLSTLAHDLYHGSVNQKDRESRRLSRLHDRLADSPVLFLQGETGTGKSYFSARMAKASGQAAVISLGPSDSEQTLMKRWQWQEHTGGDRSMKQQNRALMEWASTPSDIDGEYVTLVLDEANLAKTGLLASLNGLWEPEPCIYVNGHPVKVSSKHRVILTGNPDHYAGRQLDPALKEKLPRAYYPPLDQAFLRDRVVEPALVKQLQRHLPDRQIDTLAQSTTESVMTLWQYYQELLPEHEFTPRDLTDICSWVGWYLDRALPVNDSVTYKQMNGLIQQSFRDVLGPEISETHQDALTALEIWFAARYHSDSTLSDRVHNQTTLHPMQQAFKEFTERTRPDFDTSGSAVTELVQRLGQDLSRCQQAYHLGRKHDGRQATLIEGPAGRGKDATLNLMIESVKRQAGQRGESMPKVFALNACDCSWDKVCEKIQTAKVDGGIVVISEMNLIDSQHLEGELNDILAGDAHPGFHLFATINPPEYSGRKPLSPALKGRFRHIPIRQYNPAELRAIAEKVLPQTWHGKIMAEWLTEQHCRLRACLQRQNLPLQPTSLDLQNVARAIVQGGDFSKDGLHQCLNQHYRLYLMAAGISLGALPKSSALATSNSAFDYQLWDWFHHMVSDIERPWVIRRSDLNSIDEKRHEIRVETRLTEEEARTEIIRMVAQARWQASGLSLKPDQSDDMLTKALYRHWQRRWFDHEFGQTGVDVNSVFPLTKEQDQTLKIPAYQPCLQEADQRISARSSGALPLRPAFWYQIIGQSNPVNKASTIATDNAAEQYDPEVHEKQALALNRTTNYEYQEKSQLDDYKIFDCYHSSRLYRHLARDIYVTAKGDVKEIDLNDKDIDGVETLIPERLPGQDQPVLLTSDQALATFSCSSKNGQYALPSLNPDDHIVALRMEPDMAFTLIRNRYTGLHTLSVPDAKANQSIQVTYVVESRVASQQTLTKEALQEQSTRFDTHCSEGMKNVLDELFKTIGQQLPEVQAPLQAIKNAKDKTQLIRAITDYCAEFSGEIQPESHENFFKFLVTKRQGSCHHRVTVFIAFCRYFGIPCRLIDNFIHCFAEYSEDGGQTWKSVDLGGGPAQLKTITPAFFQPNTKGTVSSTELKKTLDLLKEFLKGADLTQQQTLAKACGMSLMELNNALATKSALPKTHLSIFEIVRNLWKEKNLTGFVMGVSMLESLETETPSGYGVIWSVFLAYNEDNLSKPMSEAIKEILSNSDEDQVTEQLKSLHSKMIVQGGANPLQWFHLILDILKHIDLTRPSVIQFVRKTLKSGWLDQPPINDFYTGLADIHHETLVRLEAVDEVKFEAAHALKIWYRKLFSREKNSQTWRLVYKSFQSRNGEAWFVTHCHDGFSSFLTYKIIQSSLQIAWTDDPEGVPNIERMLVHHPAFAKLSSGKANHRPVIILGEPSWGKTVIAEKVRVLFHRKVESSPDLKQITEKIKLNPCELAVEDYRLWNGLRYKYRQAIQQAFSYYLYEMTHSKAGGLTYCWAKATMIDHITPKDYLDIYGAHEPSSPEELYAMMYKIDSSDPFAKSLRDTHLRQALNVGNALVLRSDELTKIAEEFLNSVNLNSIYDSLT